MIKRIKLEKYHYVALVGWIAKIFTVVFSFISTRIMIDLIGIDGFALYAILFSVGGWFILFSLGMPNAMQNLIAKYSVNNKSITKLLSSVVFLIAILLIISIPLVFLITIILYNYFLSNYQNMITFSSVFFIFYFFTIFGLSQIFYKILYAINKGILPNLYPLLTSFLSLLILICLSILDINDIQTVLILLFIPYLIIFFVSYYQSIGFIVPIYKKLVIYEIYHASKFFFISTFFVYATLNIDYLIMSKLLSSYEISQYNLLMKVFGLVLFMQATLLSTSWASSSKAFYSKDITKLNYILRNNIIIGVVIVFIFSIIIYMFKAKIFLLLAGNNIIDIPTDLILIVGVYMLLRVWTDSYANILSSMNLVKISIYIVPIQAFLSIIFQYYFSTIYHLNGILYGLIISFIFTVSSIYPVYYIIKTRELKNVK